MFTEFPRKITRRSSIELETLCGKLFTKYFGLTKEVLGDKGGTQFYVNRPPTPPADFRDGMKFVYICRETRHVPTWLFVASIDVTGKLSQ